MYICIYIYKYIYVCIYTHTNTHTHTHIHIPLFSSTFWHLPDPPPCSAPFSPLLSPETPCRGESKRLCSNGTLARSDAPATSLYREGEREHARARERGRERESKRREKETHTSTRTTVDTKENVCDGIYHDCVHTYRDREKKQSVLTTFVLFLWRLHYIFAVVRTTKYKMKKQTCCRTKKAYSQ